MKALRIALLIALSVVLAVSVAGCGAKNAAAKVNGQTIPLDELNKQMENLKKQYPQMFTGADGEGRLLEFKQRLLDNLVNQVLIKQEAKKRGISVSDADIKKQIDQLKTGFKDDAAFQEALKTAGMDPSTLEGQVRDQLVTQKLIESLAKDIAVSDADIKAYYEKNKAQFAQPAQKRASHILFKPEDKAKAEKILKEVLSGGNFAALAKANSTDPGSAAKGGDLGWPTTPYVPEFEAAVKKLAKGETTKELVKTQFGWHIIRVTDERAASQKTLEQAKDDIKNLIISQRRADAYAKLLDKLRKDAKIEILVEDLKAKQNTGK